MPGCIERQALQPIEFQFDVQFMARVVRLQIDARHIDFARRRHAASVTVKPVGRPLRRRRKVEFIIRNVGRRPHESLKTGALPKLVRAQGRGYWREAECTDIAGRDVVQR